MESSRMLSHPSSNLCKPTASSINKLATATTTNTIADTRKRKRGALQDISNANTKNGGHGASVSGRPVKKTSTASILKKPAIRVSARTTTTRSNTIANRTKVATTTKTKRLSNTSRKSVSQKPCASTTVDGESETTQHVKVQTSLLSFPSMSSTKKTATSRESSSMDDTTTSDVEAVQQTAKASHIEEIPSAVNTEQAPVVLTRYEPRRQVFTYDSTDSGFDDATYCAHIQDIDAPVHHYLAYCTKLVQDLDRYHFQHELLYMSTPTYIGTIQLDINEKMRTILVDWLVEVGEEYDLDSQTFHKAINLVDRYLTKYKINRKQFQLVGCACMMIAAKFEEVYSPNVEEFVYISDQTYTAEEVLEMERNVLSALEYRVASTTCYGFLHRFLRANNTTITTDDKQQSLIKYLCDFALLFYHMLKHRPSLQAAAAIYLARIMMGEPHPWTPTLHHFTQYNAWDLRECVQDLYRLHRNENAIVQKQRDKAKAVSEKYLGPKFHAAALIPSIEEANLDKSFLAYQKRTSATSSSSTTHM